MRDAIQRIMPLGACRAAAYPRVSAFGGLSIRTTNKLFFAGSNALKPSRYNVIRVTIARDAKNSIGVAKKNSSLGSLAGARHG